MTSRSLIIPIAALLIVLGAACGGGNNKTTPKTPAATATPANPGPEDVMGDWVRANRNVDFVGQCANAKQGIDVGKLCVTLAGTRGTRQAYYLGPTFSDYTALAMLEKKPEGWTVLSVANRDLSAGNVPGIPWPLQVGDQVVVVGLSDNDCLRVREQPSQQAPQMICIAPGSTAIIQEGPTAADNFQWWHITGDGFNGWSAGTWLRLPDAIAQALTPATATPAP